MEKFTSDNEFLILNEKITALSAALSEYTAES